MSNEFPTHEELRVEHARAEFFRTACISMEAERDEIGAELDACEAECKRLAGLVREVLAQHADPESPWFNDCAPGKLCLWCENAKAALAQTAANFSSNPNDHGLMSVAQIEAERDRSGAALDVANAHVKLLQLDLRNANAKNLTLAAALQELNGENDALKSERDAAKKQLAVREVERKRLAEVYHWAQALLTALNTGDVQKESLIHKKLRQALIEYRAALSPSAANDLKGSP